MEQLANNPVTTLSGSINSAVTSLSVADASAFPTVGDFTIKINSELLRVTGVSGSTFTVTRGQESTVAASHTAGDTVTQIVTANVVSRLLAEMTRTGAANSRPSTARKGSEYYATDANLAWRYNGSNWDLIRPLYVPYANRVDVTGWTDINNTGLTWTDYGGVYLNTLVGASGTNLRGKVKSVPSAPYNCHLVIGPMLQAQAGAMYGFALYDSGTTRVKIFSAGGFDNGGRVFIENWTSPTAFSAAPVANDRLLNYNPFLYFRFQDDNTNWKYSISQDGLTWIEVFSETRNTFLTPTHVGIMFSKTNAYYSTNACPYDIYAYWET